MSKIGNDGYTTIMKVAQTVLPTLPSESIQAEKLAQNIMKLAFSRKPSSASIYHPEVYDAVEARKSLAACAKNNQAVLAQVVEKIKAATEPYEKTSLISGYNQAVFAAADVLANLADIGVRINSQTRQDLTCRVAGVLTDKATTDASFNSASWGTLTTRLAIGKNLYRLAQTDSVLSQALPAGDSINCQSLSKLRMLAETGYSAPLKAPENKPQLR